VLWMPLHFVATLPRFRRHADRVLM
jgi:hypothetical protein